MVVFCFAPSICLARMLDLLVFSEETSDFFVVVVWVFVKSTNIVNLDLFL